MYVWVCYHRIYVLLSMNISGNTHSVIEHLRCLSVFQAQSCVSSMSMYVDRNLSSFFSSHGVIEAYTYYMLHDLTHLKPLQLEGLSMLYLLTLVSGMCNSHRVTSFFFASLCSTCSEIFLSPINPLMSESTLSAWSHSIHLPRGGVWGGDPFRSRCDLQYCFTSSGLVFEYIILEWFGL